MNQAKSDEMIEDLFGTAGVPPGTNAGGETSSGLAPMILIVEDDDDIACSLTIRLKVQGYRTCLAGDALSALDIAREHAPSCAILDVNMPGGDGFSVAERLRADPKTAGMPVIFLTASMRPDMKERAEAAGGAAFMTKPYDGTALMNTVRELVNGGRLPAGS